MNEPRKLGLVLLIILAFGLVCYVVERLRDAGRGWIALITASTALLIMVLLIYGGIARDLDGRYRVKIEGEWVAVDDDAVITEPNRFGRTMVWPMYKDGKPIVRCFMPGAMI